MANRLADATSPYLLQHKDNPVDWHEWGDEAFEEARRRDVPVLLSVGYAACHWCHVMAHESFEDPAVAEEMNRLFVNVKVDREERPDVDSVYMEAVQAMTGHGGWPMTVWLDHDRRPFYAGTYFPPEPRHGMPSFGEIMDAVAGAWSIRRDDVAEQAARIIDAIDQTLPSAASPDTSHLEEAYRRIASAFDSAHGGFRGAPKFPQQPVFEFLLRVHEEPWAPEAGQMVTKTLDEMAAGGIHDQIGGGFARYSVDAHWLVPHFEKMLYDNAQLARLYLWAGIELGRPDFIAVARSTLDYMLRDLRHPEGGLFSSEDADSEGVEGKFYVWTPREIKEVLGDAAEAVIEYYGVTEEGNFEGSNILSVVRDDPPDNLDEARRALLDARSTRVRPGLDDKVIASWNGLAIRALAESGAVLGEDDLLDAARSAARFCLTHLVREGRLMRSWREGRTSVPGFLDDHAALAVGLFSLFAATGEEEWYHHAIGLVGQLDRFAGPGGSVYATDDAASELPKRPTDFTDNPLPSGSALASEAFLIAGLYTGDNAYLARADDILGSVATLIDRFPSMVGHHLSVLHAARNSRELAIVGPEWEDLSGVYWSRFRPNTALAASSTGTDSIPLLAGRLQNGKTLAYVCRGFVCDLPTSDPEELAGQLA
ncbi:MAG: thioredoxin domain-containing protein [Acidimicrobiia bacterium]|nr:thioredoxin domain-containing protein [Acidimicrobiia bacterium]